MGWSIRYDIMKSSLGEVLVATTDAGVCAILMGDSIAALEKDLRNRFHDAVCIRDAQGVQPLVKRVMRFIEHPESGIDVPLDVRGTPFQRRVWMALREIPPGATVSYASVAQRIGEPKAVRGVAQACGANAIALAIPCHRVVRSDGALSGYRWGVERKRTLLERERRSQCAGHAAKAATGTCA